mgnify:CR=1 FL=1
MTENGLKGKVFDIQKYSIHDGMGVRTIVFLKGCPLRCRWCANPESQLDTKEMLVSRPKCVSCGVCEQICSKGAMTVDANGVTRVSENCDFCGECVKACRGRGLRIAGDEYTVDQLMEEVLKDEIFYISTGGGLTVSGGEPLSQYEFLKELLNRAQMRGINTAIETCGVAPEEHFADILNYVDWLLMDLKHMDDAKHKEWTGGSNKVILKNWETAAKNKKQIICRIPVIPGFNDTEEEIADIARFVSSIGINEIHILQYHNLGESKYLALGRDYPLSGVKQPPNERMDELKACAEKHIEKVQIGG